MVRVNSCPNPGPANNLTGWIGPSLARTADGLFPRGYRAACTFTGPYGGNVGSPLMATATGARWSAVATVSVSRSQTVAVVFSCYQSGAYVTSGTAVLPAVTAGTPATVRLDQVLPAGTYNQVSVNLDGPNAVNGDVLSMGAVCAEQVDDSSIVFADGDSSGWAWDGTAGSSTSQESAVVAPTLTATYTDEEANSPTTLQTASFTPAAFDTLVVKVIAGDEGTVLGVPTDSLATHLTYTPQAASSSTNFTPERLFTAVVGASPSAMTVSVPTTGTQTGVSPTLIVERWAGAQLAATPATNATKTGTTAVAMSTTVTTTGTNSVVTWVGGDYVPVTTGTVTYRSGATQNYQRRDANINVWSAWQAATTPGAQTIGTTAPTGQKWTMLGVELLGTAPSTTTRSKSDTATVAEQVTTSASFSRTDPVTVTDTATVGELHQVDDQVTVTDTPSSTATGTRGDAATISEQVSTQGTRPAADSATVAEQVTSQSSFSRSDAATVTDSSKVGPRVTDSATVAEQMTSQATFGRSDSVTVSEGASVESLFGNLVLSVYAVDPATGALTALPDYTKLSLSPQRNSPGSITLEYPVAGQGFDLLRDTLTADRDLEIEIWNFGSKTGALRGYLQEAAGDDVDDEKTTWTFSGGFLELRMSEAIVYPQPKVGVDDLGDDVEVLKSSVTTAQWSRLYALGYRTTESEPDKVRVPQLIIDAVRANAVDIPMLADPKRELKFASATPGYAVQFLLVQARARGALDDITWDFTTAADSAGVAWPTVLSTKFSPGTSYGQILDKFVDLGLIEWAVTWDGAQRILQMWQAGGRGTDRTTGPRPVVLRGGRNLTEAPRKWSVKDADTAVLSAGAEGFYGEASSVDAQTRRGRRIESTTSAQALSTQDAVTAYAQWQLEVTSPGTLEITHGIGFLPGEPRPLIAFDVGDWVYSQTGTTMDRYRVVQWSLSADDSQNPSGTVTLNDMMQDALVKQRAKLDAIATGDTVLGTSESSGVDNSTPSPPTGLTVSSGAFASGIDAYAVVLVGWVAPENNVDGSALTGLAGYRVEWTEYAQPTAWRSAATVSGSTTQAQFSAAIDLPILVRVAAFKSSGAQSDWLTLTSPHTTEKDSTPPPTPSAVVGTAYLGVVTWTWDGKSTSGADMFAAAPDFDYCELHMSAGSNFTPTTATQIDKVYGKGSYSYAKLPDGSSLTYGTTYYARLVAVDIRKNRQTTPSAQGSAVPSKLVNLDLGPNAVARANIQTAAIGNAQIDVLAVNSGQISDLSVGKLTTGLFTASMVVSTGKIGTRATGVTGLGWEGDSAGLRLYNAADTVTVNLNTADGSALVTGEYRSALTGRRFVINPLGSTPDEVQFYRSSGPQFGRIRAIDTGAGIGINIRSGVTAPALSAEMLVTQDQASLLYGDIANQIHRSRIIVDNDHSYVSSPVVDISADLRYATGDALQNRVSFFFVGTNGLLINNSLVEFRRKNSDEPWLHAPFRDSGIVFGNNGANGWICAANNLGGFQQMAAAAFSVQSGRAAKENVRDARDELDPLATIRGARAQAYTYRAARWRQPPATEADPEPAPVEVEAPTRIGVIAEDLPAVLVEQGPTGMGDNTDKMINLGDQIGVLWGAVGQLIDLLEERKIYTPPRKSKP